MTKKITLSIVLVLVSVSLAFCGKKEEPKPEVKEVKEEVKQPETAAPEGDLGAKIKAYEDFVTKFCALSEKMKGAALAEKATLSADFAKDSANLKTLQADLDAIFELGQALPKRPKVFFEEWKDPLISGIRWVSELIEIAGGEDIFPELRNCQSGSERIVTADEVAKRNPDVIIASWCGRKVEKLSTLFTTRPNYLPQN